MLLAVDHCHKNGILHRDVKLENFLVSRDVSRNNPYGISVKLTDFGLSCNYDPSDPPYQYCGTVTSMAPEVILGKRYGPKVDSFSLGVALYELITGEVPWTGSKNIVKSQILNSELEIDTTDYQLWADVEDEAMDLIRKLTQKD